LNRELHEFLVKSIRLAEAKRVIVASGHDHILQHNKEQGLFDKVAINYIISGGGYKQNYGAVGHGASFVQSKRGYGVLNFYADGSTWLDFYTIAKNGQNETLAYRKKIYETKPELNAYDYATEPVDSVNKIVKAPNPKFKKGLIHTFLLGDQYREIWTTPITTDEFKLGAYHDGLLPIKQGGGLFSHTLRLKNAEDKQYVLRSVNKDFYKVIPKAMKHLEILRLYEDQNTAGIPYGALYIAELSKYANIYHTAPQLVYLDDRDQLGPFSSYFSKGHYILEARPSGDWKDTKLFGASSKVIGYSDLLFKLRKRTTHKVDQSWTLRSRLFDFIIHDRDRHDDQWRWAAFKENNRTIYRPVPRDRDWAFFKFQGVLPTILGEFVYNQYKSFKGDHIDVKSLTVNSNNFDRYFLNELTWKDWEKEISFLEDALTEEVLMASLSVMPEESIDYMEDEVVRKLISRMKILKKEVRKYYDFLSEEVEITGTDEKDIFIIVTGKSGETEVVVARDSDKHGRVVRYKRCFAAEETKEIRIYGLAGEDKFFVDLQGKGQARIRIIGGVDDDEINFQGKAEPLHKIQVYDTRDGMSISDMRLVEDHRDDEIETNLYDRLGYKFNSSLPWPNIGYYPDEGLRIGFGFLWTRHAWRKAPFQSRHFFNMVMTPLRDDEFGDGFGLDLDYKGEWPGLFGKKWGYRQDISIDAPNFINYFGSPENSTSYLREDNEFQWVRRSSWELESYLVSRRQRDRVVFKFGTGYESHKLHPQANTIVLVSDEFSDEDLNRNHFLGFQGDVHINTLDRLNHPTEGFSVKAFSKYRYELERDAHTLDYGGNIAFFLPLSVSKKLVFGSNSGFQNIYGDPRFYQLPSMGTHFFRPSRANRYRGEGLFYQQLDLRYKLCDWNNSILPITIGAVAGYDFGQVYYKGLDMGGVKHGWTFGLSFDLLKRYVVHTRLSHSEEGSFFVLKTGFDF